MKRGTGGVEQKQLPRIVDFLVVLCHKNVEVRENQWLEDEIWRDICEKWPLNHGHEKVYVI